jgi:hypothetical protein
VGGKVLFSNTVLKEKYISSNTVGEKCFTVGGKVLSSNTVLEEKIGVLEESWPVLEERHFAPTPCWRKNWCVGGKLPWWWCCVIFYCCGRGKRKEQQQQQHQQLPNNQTTNQQIEIDSSCMTEAEIIEIVEQLRLLQVRQTTLLDRLQLATVAADIDRPRRNTANRRLVLGDRVRVINPRIGQSSTGVVSKITESRTTVTDRHGRTLSRDPKNLVLQE